MKKCPYCGKEYSEEVVNCLTDNYPLIDSTPDVVQPESATAACTDQAEVGGEGAGYVCYPAYTWKARDAWKCLGFLFVIEIVLGLFVRALETLPPIGKWSATGPGYFCTRLLFYTVGLLVAAYFARTETLATFWSGFGLERKPTQYAWFGVSMALFLRGFGHIMLALHLGNGVSAYDIYAFRHSVGPARYFFLVPLLLLAPIFEEAINRGFLYRAFRGSYSLLPSLILLLAWNVLRHWSQYKHWVAATDLSLLTLVLCYIREKSGNTWDCILCHLVFNGSLLFTGSFR